MMWRREKSLANLKDSSKGCIGFGLISRGKKKNNKCYVPPDFPCGNTYASDKPCHMRPFRLKEKLKIYSF